MSEAAALVSDADKLDFIERAVLCAVQDLQAVQKIQGESVNKELAKLHSKIAKGDAASALQQMEARLQICEKEQEQLANSVLVEHADFEARLNDFQQMLPEKQDEQEKPLDLRTFAITQGNQASHRHTEVTSQTDVLQRKIAELSAWRSKVDAQLESLWSEVGKFSSFSLPAPQQSDPLKDSLNADSADLQTADSRLPQTLPHARQDSVTNFDSKDSQPTKLEVENNAASISSVLGLHTPAKKFDKESIFFIFDLGREYLWEESVYDCFFMIGRDFVTAGHNLMIFFGFLLNLLFVVLTIGTLASDSFAERPFENMSPLERWRDTEAHSSLYFNRVTHMTLATRVCALDAGLSLANDQKKLLSEIHAYLGSFHGISGQGRVLCTLAIGLWLADCALEMRKSMNFFIAIHTLPRARTSVCVQATSFEFCSLSGTRILVGSFIAMTRLVFACALLWFGTKWLAFTTSVPDLLLNSSALSYALEIDKVLFGVVSPYRVIGMMRSLIPVRLPATKWLMTIPVSLACFIVMILIVANVGFISDITSAMAEAHKILCEPEESLNILVGGSALGWSTYTEAVAWDGETAVPITQNEITVDRVVHGHVDSPYVGYHVKTIPEILQIDSMRTSQYVNQVTFGCSDLNGLNKENPRLGMRLGAAVGNTSLQSLSGCEDAKVYCRASGLLGINLRFMCPCTCGCAGIQSGLWDLAISDNGCPQAHCSNKMNRALQGVILPNHCQGDGFQGVSCEDEVLDNLGSGHWPAMLHRMLAVVDIREADYNNLTTLGCEALHYMGLNKKWEVCSMKEPVLKYGAAAFCPEACFCKDFGCPGMCPKTCCQ